MNQTKTRSVVGWVLAVALALSFIASGVPKLMPGEGMIRRFEAWGYSAGFATVIGVVEVVGGILVLVPRVRALGAMLLAMNMAGAGFTHLRSGIGSPAMAAVYGVLALVLLWLTAKQPRGGGPAGTSVDRD